MIIQINGFYRTRTGAVLQVVKQNDFGDSFYADFCYQTDLGFTPYREDGRVYRDRLDPMDLVAEVVGEVSDAPFLRTELCTGCFVKYQDRFIDIRASENRVHGFQFSDVEQAILEDNQNPDKPNISVLRLLAEPAAEMIGDLDNYIKAVQDEIFVLIDENMNDEDYEPRYNVLRDRREALRDKRSAIKYPRVYA